MSDGSRSAKDDGRQTEAALSGPRGERVGSWLNGPVAGRRPE